MSELETPMSPQAWISNNYRYAGGYIRLSNDKPVIISEVLTDYVCYLTEHQTARIKSELETLAFEIADEAAQSAIECNLLMEKHHAHEYVFFYEGSAAAFAALVKPRKGCWWNFQSASLEAKEPIERDLRYLEMRGKLERHPDRPELVRVSR